jgi:predicted AlkP superfamily pyrophosphatase or phosphodiesterase
MRLLSSSILGITLAATAAAQAATHPAPRPLPPQQKVPTLVIFLTIDQMRADYLTRFGPQLTGGLGRLAKQGAFFTNAMLDYESTETAPGHATGMSGRFPRSTGIVSNSLGVFDPQAPVIGSTTGFASPFRFRGGGLTEWLRIKDPRTRALSVSRKDRGAILPLGRTHQNVFWYDGANGNFTTSTYYADTLPTWLRTFNAKRIPASYTGSVWTLLLPDSAYPEKDSIVWENFGTDFLFPHALSKDTATALRTFADSPYMDAVTLQVALAGMKALNFGAGDATDVLAISLSTTDQIGHRYGPDSREIHDQILRLDRELGAFFDSVFAVRDSMHVVITLTADHGVAPLPEEYAMRTHKPAQRLNLAAISQRYQAKVAALGGDSTDFWFEDAMLWVHREPLIRAHVNVDSLVSAFAAEVRATPGVASVMRVADLAKDTLKDPIARRWYHTVPPDFPVELVVTLKEFSVWGTYAPGIHGSPYDYDNNVPVVMWGAPFKPGRYTMPSLLVDLAPTLAWVTATRPTEHVDGTILWSALK